MAESRPSAKVVRFPGRLNVGRSEAQWKDTVAEAQHHLDRSIGALEAYIAQASPNSANPPEGTERLIRAVKTLNPSRWWLVGVAGLCVPLCLVVWVSWLAATVTAVAGIAVIALITLGVNHVKHLAALQDTDVDTALIYKAYRDMQAIVVRRWVDSEVRDPYQLDKMMNNVLTAILDIEARRITHANKRPTTLIILEDAGSQLVARRSSRSSLGSKITRGMRCPHDSLLDSTLDHYAQFHYKVQYCGYERGAYLVALSDAPLSTAAQAMVEQATVQYQSMALLAAVAKGTVSASA